MVVVFSGACKLEVAWSLYFFVGWLLFFLPEMVAAVIVFFSPASGVVSTCWSS